MRNILKTIFAAALLLAAAAILSCGEQGPPPTPTPTPIDPAALVSRAAQALGDLDSFHFTLSHPEGGTPMLEALLIHDAEGDVLKPDRLAVEFGGVFGNIYITASFISIGEDNFMTNPFSGDWEVVPAEINPIAFFSPERGITNIIASISKPVLIDSDESGWRIAGLLPPQALESIFGDTISSDDESDWVSVELTLDAESYLMRSVKMEGRVTEREPPGTVREITLSGFNEPPEIEPPL
jgi:hypothetical protein